jgi:hypothetical protein
LELISVGINIERSNVVQEIIRVMGEVGKCVRNETDS